MKNKLINDITAYINYLNEKGLYVTVHGGYAFRLFEHNIHKHPYCTLIKAEKDLWKNCLRCQKKVLNKYKEEMFFGMCHAGVEEYVFFVNDKTFISVSGYGINREKAQGKIKKLADEFYLNTNELIFAYENSLKHEKENEEELKTIIKPLCHMLSLLEIQLASLPKNEESGTIYDSLLSYILMNFTSDISVKDIAKALSCSESTVCHTFKKHSGVPIKKYIADLRLKKAKEMLELKDLPISTVAQLCGFTNVNYFPTAFNKAFGISPTEYREGLGKK